MYDVICFTKHDIFDGRKKVCKDCIDLEYIIKYLKSCDEHIYRNLINLCETMIYNNSQRTKEILDRL
jgi:hypothetical protein